MTSIYGKDFDEQPGKAHHPGFGPNAATSADGWEPNGSV